MKKIKTVSGAKLAVHLGFTATYVTQLVAAGVLRRGADGLFALDENRTAYLAHLRARQAAKAKAAEPFDLYSLALSEADIKRLMEQPQTFEGETPAMRRWPR